MHQVVEARRCVADVVERADVRMVERGDRPRLALEALRAACGSAASSGGSTLIATVRSSRVSRARYTSPIPPAPSAPTISYGPRRVPGERDTQAAFRLPLDNDRTGL